MSTTNKVRTSRDGDQFHYLWAARRCLRLLSDYSELVTISVEDPSPADGVVKTGAEAGEEVIDLAEYYGSAKLEEAEQVYYIQLKHSTQYPNKPWTFSGLEATFKKFAEIYKGLISKIDPVKVATKIKFQFVTNRPVATVLTSAIREIADGALVTNASELKKLERCTGLTDTSLAAFCRLLEIKGQEQGYLRQRSLLRTEIRAFLPGPDFDADLQLKELVTRKALSESASNPEITKIDVLQALETDEFALFPAPCLIEDVIQAVPREQESEILHTIVSAGSQPIIIHAEGGVGKSVISRRIVSRLPTGSVAILYDCFGNGQYRNTSFPRHRHKEALVQIANELAAMGLCDPLIPNQRADRADYIRAFRHRIELSSENIRAVNPDAFVCIILDAADNAEIAATENGYGRSFAYDLLRESFSAGVRMVALCRTHRQFLFGPLAHAIRIELRPFSRNETAANLRRVFSEVTEQDVDEFHRLSSHNPRVQATVLTESSTLLEALRALGPNPTTIEDTIAKLYHHAIDRLHEELDREEYAQIQLMCRALAVLKPLIPISVLAAICKVDSVAIKSFISDFGRPLRVVGESVHFFDEPAETWFRIQFRLDIKELREFIEVLKPLTSTNSYVAAQLPFLMLEAGQLDELIKLAVNSEGLPSEGNIERHTIELQRLQFALKASLRNKQYLDATKLAFKAGGTWAGDNRRQKLLQENTDLTALFFEPGQLQELVSRQTFQENWYGSRFAFEASLLTARPELRADGRSRLRIAEDWFSNWTRLTFEQQQDQPITDACLVEIAIAFLNIGEFKKAVRVLTIWEPRSVTFKCGCLLAKRLIDHMRYDELDKLAAEAGEELELILAVMLELWQVYRTPPKAVIETVLRFVLNQNLESEEASIKQIDEPLSVLLALIEVCLTLSLGNRDELTKLLDALLPKEPPPSLFSRHLGPNYTLLRAYTLHSALISRELEVTDLAYPQLREKSEGKSLNGTQEAREFQTVMGSLLPWCRLWTKSLLSKGSNEDLGMSISTAMASASKQPYGYVEFDRLYPANEIARLWLSILVYREQPDKSQVDKFNQWLASLRHPLYTGTYAHLARVAARQNGMEAHALDYAQKSFDLTRSERGDANMAAAMYVELARAVLPSGPHDAGAYFREAFEVASKVGDENLSRWNAILDLAVRAENPSRPVPATAYKLARCAELTKSYDESGHFNSTYTAEAIAGLCPSSAITIMSRWRDRRFGFNDELMPTIVERLLKNGNFDPKIAITLICFRFFRNQPELLAKALTVCETQAERNDILAFFYCYMRLDERGSNFWQHVKDIIRSHKLPFPLDLDQVIEFFKHQEQIKYAIESESQTWRDKVGQRDTPDWDAIFANLDLSSAQDIVEAYKRFNDSLPDYGFADESFYDTMFSRVPRGLEPVFIEAITSIPVFNLYELRPFFKGFPTEWKNRIAVKTKLAETCKRLCQRFCLEASKNRYFEAFPLQKISEVSGLPESELIDVILSAVGELTEITSSERLFALISLLVPKLSKSEALEALEFGLDWFDPVLDENDGDGSWSPALMPPKDPAEAIAGYIWVALGAPTASLRWEATHVVRALCRFAQKRVLDYLIKLARTGKAGPFADANLHFYDLHARQWLLIALARAAQDYPEALSAYYSFFIDIALHNLKHVLIREFAAKAILTLDAKGAMSLSNDIRVQLEVLNSSKFPIKTTRRFERRSKAKETATVDAPGLYFGFDIGPYWFANLADCFGFTQKDIEVAASQEIIDYWNLNDEENWPEDKRSSRRLYIGHSTQHSHGSFPKTDDLQFYLSYHAMMTVAGKLLDTKPVYRDPEESTDAFTDWITGHGLTRADGRWLADRRDPAPLEWPEWKDEKEQNAQQWVIEPDYAEKVLGLPSRNLNVWGYWTFVSGRREEKIHIRSALVSSARSEALLRALHFTNYYDIPDEGHEREIAANDFVLKGWVNTEGTHSKFDELDPWAGDIYYPPLAPASFVLTTMDIKADPEGRIWSNGIDEPVLWSRCWAFPGAKEDDEIQLEKGQRLEASFAFIIDFLKSIEMDLIIYVSINRKLKYARYERHREGEIDHVPPVEKLFLIKNEGQILTI